MAKLSLVTGTTSYIAQVFIQDSSSATGAGLTGLTNASSSLVAYFHRDTDTTATAISLVTMTVGTFTSSGFKEIDATNMPGWYQLCPPNTALASGAKSCAIHLKGAANMAPLALEIELTAVNNQSATAFMTSVASVVGAVGSVTGLTASDVGAIKTKTDFLPSATAGAAGGVFIAGTNAATSVTTALTANITGNLSGSVGSVTGNVGGSVASVTARVTANSDQLAGQTVTAAAGVTFPSSVASPTNITAGTITTVTNLTNAPTSGDLTATMKTSVTTAATAATPAAASVTGSVGSIATGGIAAASFAAGAIDATAIATDAIGSAEISAAAVTKIQSGLATPTNITAGTITTVTNLTNAPTSGDLTSTMKTSVATAALTTAMTESYSADGATMTLAQFAYLITAFLGEKSVSGTTLTVHKLDGSTSAATFTLSDATNPVSITRAS